MKIRNINLLLLLFVATAFVGVSCAATKVPVATMKSEKAIIPTSVEYFANHNGAIPDLTVVIKNYCAGMFTDILAVKSVRYCIDENFYLCGYKAKLNKTVKEIAIPPDSKNKYVSMPLKFC